MLETKPHFMILFWSEEMIHCIEDAAKTCYKSKKSSTPEEFDRFLESLKERQHFAMLEFADVIVHIIHDRGFSHEAVRHRIASFAQESTRYCNYGSEKFGAQVQFINPVDCIKYDKQMCNLSKEQVDAIMCEWYESCKDAERHYMKLLDLGSSPQFARGALTNSTKTEIVIKMNIREWRHFFELRAIGITGSPHPQMQEIAKPMLLKFASLSPVLFGDLAEKIMI